MQPLPPLQIDSEFHALEHHKDGSHEEGSSGKENAPRTIDRNINNKNEDNSRKLSVVEIRTDNNSNVRIDSRRIILTVGEIPNMLPDPNVVHPFLRVWLVDAMTGDVLHKAEHAFGFISHPCDLRLHRVMSPIWDEIIPLDVLENVVTVRPDATLLFEFMDITDETIRGERGYVRGPYNIAWGYLRLLDHRRQPHFLQPSYSTLHVQLFKYPYQRSILKSLRLSLTPSRFKPSQSVAMPLGAHIPPRTRETTVPDVFYIFSDHRNRMDPYNATLSVQLHLESVGWRPEPRFYHPREQLAYEEIFCKAVPVDSVAMHYHLCQRQATIGSRRGSVRSDNALSFLTDRRSGLVDDTAESDGAADNFSATDIDEDPGEVLTCHRGRGERCASLELFSHLCTLPCGTQGCLALKFSPCGRYLAAGVCGEHNEVHVYDVFHERVRRVAQLLGHHKAIHDLAWSSDSALIVSGSADTTARVWSLPWADHAMATRPEVPPFPGGCALAHLADDDSCVCTLTHTSFVYACVFLQHDAHIATGGFDGVVRIWSIAEVAELRVLDRLKSRVVRLVGDPVGNKLWCADGTGRITIWKLHLEEKEVTTMDRPRVTEQFKNKGVVELMIGHGGTVMVQTASDASVTLMDSIGFRVRRRIGGLPRSALAQPVATLSPDAATVMCSGGGGSSGVVAWSVEDGEPVGPLKGCVLPVISSSSHLHINNNAARRGSHISDTAEDELSTIPCHRLVWSPHDNKIAMCTYAAHSNYIRLWYASATHVAAAQNNNLGTSVSRSVFFSRGLSARSLPRQSTVFPRSVLVPGSPGHHGRRSISFLHSVALDHIPRGRSTAEQIKAIMKKWSDAVKRRTATHGGGLSPQGSGGRDQENSEHELV